MNPERIVSGGRTAARDRLDGGWLTTGAAQRIMAALAVSAALWLSVFWAIA